MLGIVPLVVADYSGSGMGSTEVDRRGSSVRTG